MPGDGPWLFRYVEDPAEKSASELGLPPPRRPVVEVALSASRKTPRALALVDSGSERIFAAPSLARAAGVDLTGALETTVGIGGEWRRVRFIDLQLHLYDGPFKDEPEELVDWEAQVGFFDSWEPPWPVLLGQRGFFDRFTITMHRAVPALAVEPYEAFDERFGVLVEEADDGQPRFRY